MLIPKIATVAFLAYLGDLPFVSFVGPRLVVCEGFWACEIVVAARRSNDIPLAGDLTGESRHRSGH